MLRASVSGWDAQWCWGHGWWLPASWERWLSGGRHFSSLYICFSGRAGLRSNFQKCGRLGRQEKRSGAYQRCFVKPSLMVFHLFLKSPTTCSFVLYKRGNQVLQFQQPFLGYTVNRIQVWKQICLTLNIHDILSLPGTYFLCISVMFLWCHYTEWWWQVPR